MLGNLNDMNSSPIKVTIVLVVQLPMPCVLCPDPSQNINNQKLKLQCGQCLQKHKEKAWLECIVVTKKLDFLVEKRIFWTKHDTLALLKSNLWTVEYRGLGLGHPTKSGQVWKLFAKPLLGYHKRKVIWNNIMCKEYYLIKSIKHT